MQIGSLFAGIGGLELGLEWSGLGPTIWQVERDAWCRWVLGRHWPAVPRHADVRHVGAAQLASVDVIVGGFPCQDVSVAGKQAGLAGKRSGLWVEYARIVRELRPAFVVVENVPGLVTRGLDVVVADLDAAGYAVEGTRIRASDVDAPHRRERLFLVAYRCDLADAVRERPQDRERGGAAEGPAGRGGAPGEPGDVDAAWPTPTASASRRGGTAGRGHKAQGGPSLAEAVFGESLEPRTWPTPVTTDAKGARRATARSGTWTSNEGTTLTDAVWMAGGEWPTPTASRYGSSLNGDPGDGRGAFAGAGKPSLDSIAASEGAPLNPEWVEALMGFPAGWTRDEGDLFETSIDRADPGRWPAPPGAPQHAWEPPRAERRNTVNRAQRLHALGNAVVPQVARVVGDHVVALARRFGLIE